MINRIMQQKGYQRALLPILLIMLTGFISGCDIFGTAAEERAPQVEIIRPFDQSAVAGKNLKVSVNAVALGEDNWVSYVTLNVNGVQAGTTEFDGTYHNLTLDTFQFPDGVYRVEAIAFDRFQARGISAPVLVNINNVSDGPGPIMNITDPSELDAVFGITRIVAVTKPGEPYVTKVDLLIDGVPVATETNPIGGDTFIFDFDADTLPLGEHIFEVKAYSGPTVFRISDDIAVVRSVDDGSSEGVPGSIRWKTPGIVGDVDGAVAVGFNNDLYIGTTNQILYAFDHNGNKKWEFTTKGAIDSSPLVGNNEDIFVTASGGRLYGLGSEGTKLWGWNTNYSSGSEVRSSPTLAADGTIYFGDSNGFLHAVKSFDGLKSLTGSWPVHVTAQSIVTPPVIGRDETIYVGSTDGHVYAYDPRGVKVWKTTENIGSVMVGMALIEKSVSVTLPTGVVNTTTIPVLYVVTNKGRLYSLSGIDGSVLWSYELAGPLRSGPVIGPDGTIYVGTSVGLIALNEDTDPFTPRLRFIHVADDVGTPVIDSNEVIYFMSGEDIKAINPNNTPAWDFNLQSEADGPLTITRDGALIVVTENGYLYSFETGSVGLNPEKWPTFQRNARHTGRLGIDATDG